MQPMFHRVKKSNNEYQVENQLQVY
jgi:TonB family protein